MAQLNEVKTVGIDVIEYEGGRYVVTEDDAAVGDIVRHDVSGYDFLPKGSFYIVVDRSGDIQVVDEDGDHMNVDLDFTVFRREVVTLSTAQLIEAKRAELAELEAKLAEETTLKVGDYARVIEANPDDDEISVGDIVVIDELDTVHTDGLPYRARRVGSYECWAWVPSATKLSPAEARTALIAQVDALFAN
ncbi:hypothetical protein [Cohnella silvisoli]|uniref:DUF3006 domain-containing protein n=1 Tax=Cohnella silvisoli TaxID=2873699 RepID=A0ABV1KYY4_9BACL|nr:hypothetical protein [Cohnella silvisoli]MCD9024346.1 hypothetical protein [Cohnella silvisoli]